MSQHAADASALTLVSENKLAELLPSDPDVKRFEASGVLARNGYLYVVFDNLSRVARLSVRASGSRGAAWLGEHSSDEGFEDIAYDRIGRRFYLLIEASRLRSSYRSTVVECDEKFHEIRRTRLEFAFESENKGFEGLTCVRRQDGGYLLALCEGNKCKAGKSGRKPGHGRIQIFHKRADSWRHEGTIRLPRSVTFEDYSALDVVARRVAIVSQSCSKIWVGLFAPGSWDFVDDGTVYSLPRDSKNRILYCSAEGIAWLGAHQVAIVSDRSKTGNQRRSCREKDQSIHIFAIREPTRPRGRYAGDTG